MNPKLCKHCAEIIFSGHKLWCPVLAGQREYRPEMKPSSPSSCGVDVG